MKKSLLIIALLFFACKSFGQQFDPVEFHKHLGKIGQLCDTVKELKIVNDTLTYLSMGGVPPNKKYTIAITSNSITLDWVNLKGKVVCVSGVFELYKNEPRIIVSDPAFIKAQ